MSQNATLKKIAAQLNLSISTVSRALSNHPDISDQTKQKVRELATLVEYEPNSYAINLRTNKSKLLGLLVPAISDMFHATFIEAIEEGARKGGYSIMVLQSGDDPLREIENLNICKQNRVDGVFIAFCPDIRAEEIIHKFKKSAKPVILFEKPAGMDAFDSVCMADEDIAAMAARRIIQSKKKRILALFGNEKSSITTLRRDTFLQIFGEQYPVAEIYIQFCNSSADAKQAVASAIKKSNRPDHVFCMNDEILMGAMKCLNHSGLSIPGEISVLAISNGVIPELFKPEITYIETSARSLGRLAITRMLENLKSITTVKSIILPSRLVEGASI